MKSNRKQMTMHVIAAASPKEEVMAIEMLKVKKVWEGMESTQLN